MATKTIKAKMQQYCGTAVELSIANVVLLRGQIGVETDTRKMKVGDGVTSWNDLEYTSSDLPVASSSALGGIKVGQGLAIEDGVLSTDLRHKFRINLSTDGLASDLIGAQIVVYGEEELRYTWQGTEIIVKQPPGIDIVIFTQEINGYNIGTRSYEYISLIEGDTRVEFFYYDVVKDLTKSWGNYVFPNGRITANCYIVYNEGEYRFPLVYGNAIKDGQPNPAAYTVIGNSQYNFPFVDHNGVQITSPYIEQTNNGAYTVTSAEEDGLYTKHLSISDIVLEQRDDCKYIRFRLNSAPVEGGNTRINAKVGNTIVWSWHIWLVPQMGGADFCPVLNNTNVSYVLTLPPLGWKYDDADVNQSLGSERYKGTALLYQWGRKDPLVAKLRHNDTTNYTGVSGQQNVSGAQGQASSYKESIKSPSKIWRGSSYFWCAMNNTPPYNLWNARLTTYGRNDDQDMAIKTIYDPCPPMFMVPAGNAFTGITDDKIIEYNYGVKFEGESDTVFIPAAGDISIGNDNKPTVNYATVGMYWTYAMGSGRYYTQLYIASKTSVNSRGYYGYQLAGIIPVLEPSYRNNFGL